MDNRDLLVAKRMCDVFRGLIQTYGAPKALRTGLDGLDLAQVLGTLPAQPIRDDLIKEREDFERFYEEAHGKRPDPDQSCVTYLQKVLVESFEWSEAACDILGIPDQDRDAPLPAVIAAWLRQKKKVLFGHQIVQPGWYWMCKKDTPDWTMLNVGYGEGIHPDWAEARFVGPLDEPEIQSFD